MPSESPLARGRLFASLALAIVFVWAYWPTFGRLVASWERDRDYSHGWLVVPVALFFLWARRTSRPALAARPSWLGLGMILAAGVLRVIGGLYFLDSLDGWSILLWLLGAVWFCGGRPLARWSLPSIGFLFFMVRIPFRAEGFLTLPMQRAATIISCWMLQCLGQPAIAEGNTVLLGEHRLDVEQACSGISMLMGIAALALAYTVLTRVSPWKKAVLIGCLVPIALLANSIRIVATGIMYQSVPGDLAKKLSHDAAGWLVIPLAASMFAAVLWYLNRLFVELESAHSTELLARPEASSFVG